MLDKEDEEEYVYFCSCNTTKKKFSNSNSLGDFIKHSIPGKSNCKYFLIFFFS